ncbi:MAG: ParB N-terminal domain-containing protein [Lachnospiraceae bacterium]|nr:ParB N-terminal domain-containing protein [Lachnospiraceae bacterium]
MSISVESGSRRGSLELDLQFFAEGDSKYQNAGFWERLTTKKTNVENLHANPLDEFSNPKIGPSESAVSKYIKEINSTGKLSNPIEVQKLTSGGYEIVNGHHRWLAAKRVGLDKVPIKIMNYNN